MGGENEVQARNNFDTIVQNTQRMDNAHKAVMSELKQKMIEDNNRKREKRKKLVDEINLLNEKEDVLDQKAKGGNTLYEVREFDDNNKPIFPIFEKKSK